MKFPSLKPKEKPKPIFLYDEEGKLHNDDGPAIVISGMRKEWWIHGKCHRVGKPAVETSNGVNEWWRDGEHQCTVLPSKHRKQQMELL